MFPRLRVGIVRRLALEHLGLGSVEHRSLKRIGEGPAFRGPDLMGLGWKFFFSGLERREGIEWFSAGRTALSIGDGSPSSI